METLNQGGLYIQTLIQKGLHATIVMKRDMLRQNSNDDYWWTMT